MNQSKFPFINFSVNVVQEMGNAKEVQELSTARGPLTARVNTVDLLKSEKNVHFTVITVQSTEQDTRGR